MLETIANVNSVVNGIVWGVPAMACILGVGSYLTIRNKGIQFSKFGYAIKSTLGKMFKKSEAKEGAITPFQAVCTALAATIGTGNIAGVAGAIAIGGPGAVFWMWISALLGMCTKFSEVTLAVNYREVNEHGDYVGGPMYYIKNGLAKHWHWLAYAFAGFGAIACFGIGNTTQVNTIVSSIDTALINYNLIDANHHGGFNLAIGIIITITLLVVLLGGIKRLGSVTEKLVPFMAIFYIVLGLGVIIVRIDTIPAVFKSIFEGAFNPSAVTGGAVGGMFIAMQKGISRGIFSNEAGLGSGSIAHATADVDHPVKQGFFGIFEVFADTIVVCTMTALVVLCSGVEFTYGEAAGVELTISGFTAIYGNWVSIFAAVAVICFAFSTVLGWGLYGARCVEFLFGSKSIKIFTILYSLVAIAGATMDLGLIWDLADTFNGLMAIPNLIALALLAPKVVELVKDFYAKKLDKEDK